MSGGFYIDFDDWYDQGVCLILLEVLYAVVARNFGWFTISGVMLGLAGAGYVIMLRERRREEAK